MEEIERKKPNNLMKLLKERGITYQRFSMMSGVSESMFTKITRYSYYPTEDVRENISKALHIEEEEIWPIGEGE